MNPTLIAILGGAVLLTAGCSNTAGGGGTVPELPPLPARPESRGPLRAKPSYANARQLSDKVKAGMPQSMIEAMFGLPDKAGYKIYGRSTESPWRALVWEWVFEDVKPNRALSVVFQDDRGVWRVNHGDWPE